MIRARTAVTCVAFLVLSTTAWGQIFSRQRGRVYYEPIPSTSTQPETVYSRPPSGPTSPSALCGGCSSPSSDCKAECLDCLPKLIHLGNCPGSLDCKPINSVPQGTIDKDSREIPFYKYKIPFEASINIPAIEEQKREIIKFKKIKLNFVCCELEICVPCECCVETKTVCVEKLKKVKLEARIRQDGRIDFYVLGVSGFPPEWIYLMCVSLADANERFKMNFSR